VSHVSLFPVLSFGSELFSATLRLFCSAAAFCTLRRSISFWFPPDQSRTMSIASVDKAETLTGHDRCQRWDNRVTRTAWGDSHTRRTDTALPPIWHGGTLARTVTTGAFLSGAQLLDNYPRNAPSTFGHWKGAHTVTTVVLYVSCVFAVCRLSAAMDQDRYRICHQHLWCPSWRKHRVSCRQGDSARAATVPWQTPSIIQGEHNPICVRYESPETIVGMEPAPSLPALSRVVSRAPYVVWGHHRGW